MDAVNCIGIKYRRPLGCSWLALLIMCLCGCQQSLKNTESLATTIDWPDQWESVESKTAQEALKPVLEWDIAELNALIEMGLIQNRNLARSEERLNSALSELKILNADKFPQVNVSAQGTRARQIVSETPTVLTTTGNQFEARLNLNWEIDLWQRIRDQNLAAYGTVQAVYYDFEYARISLTYQIAKLWFDLTEANLQVELAKNTLNSYLQSSHQIQQQYERGLIGALDLRLFESQVHEARANLQNRRAQKDTLQRALNLLIGNYPSTDITTSSQFPELRDTIPSSLPSELLQKRPDLRSAERRLSAAEMSVSATRKLRLPAFSLTSSIGTRSNDLDNIVNRDYHIWNLLGNLSMPLFQAGRITAQIERAQSDYRSALLAYEQTILEALQEVENSLSAETYLENQYTSIASASFESQSAERIAMDQYERGLVDIITVLETQRRAFSAESRRINLLNQRFQNRLNLLLALGGGWIDPEPVF